MNRYTTTVTPANIADEQKRVSRAAKRGHLVGTITTLKVGDVVHYQYREERYGWLNLATKPEKFPHIEVRRVNNG